jgi:biopolymer transport protein TolR
MARRTPLTSVKQVSEINLTPLMDVVFILLITFLITFPLIEQGVPVNLPKGKAPELNDIESVTLTLERSGKVYLDQTHMDRPTLQIELTRMGASAPDTRILVRADEEIAYGEVVQLLKLLHEAGLAKMALVTQPE